MKPHPNYQNELKSLYQKGDRLYSLGQLEGALKIFQKALEITKLINSPEQRLDIVYRLGLVHSRIGEYFNALNYLKLALKLAKKIGGEAKIATIYNEQGKTYYLLKEYINAFDSYSKALRIFQKLKDIVGIGKTINHISTIYNLTGLSDQALKYSRQSLKIFQKLDKLGKINKFTTKMNESIALHNMGESYFILGRPCQAQAFLELALDIRQKLWEDSLDRLESMEDNVPELDKNQNYDHTYPEKMSIYDYKEKDGFHRSIFAQYGQDLIQTMSLVEKVYQDLGNEQKANNYHQQAVEIQEKVNSDFCSVTN
ncbi:MAG: tetratricopeptide repeat protein [Cyanobacteria bacterium P01_H01_bin.35]